VTDTFSVAVFPPDEAVMVALPTETPVTTPEVLTVAMPFALELKVTPEASGRVELSL
jgi:hypothetical protein